MRVVLGNRHAVQGVKRVGAEGPEAVDLETLKKGKRATRIELPDDYAIGTAFTAITDPAQGVWSQHATEGATPAWVASDKPLLAALLADHFGGIEVRDLDEHGGTGLVEAVVKSAAVAETLAFLALPTLAFLALSRMSLQLRTNIGADYQARQMGGAASATVLAKYVGVTANTTAPAAGDTTLTGEITTAGGGLIRQTAVYAHTTSAASYTLTTVFTANGTDTLPVTIGKRGIFDAASGGNLVFETLVSPTATLSASGDSLTLTDTISL